MEYPKIGKCTCKACQLVQLNPEPSDYLIARMANLRRAGKSPGNPKWYHVPTMPRFEFKPGLPPKFPRLPTGAEWNAKLYGALPEKIKTRYVTA